MGTAADELVAPDAAAELSTRRQRLPLEAFAASANGERLDAFQTEYPQALPSVLADQPTPT